jgi:3-deoxy-D-manno-octulosonic-acid transferase
MRTLYNVLFTVFFCLSAPFYFFKMWRRGGWLQDFGQRFGRYGTRVKQAVTNRHTLWLHAVSVGEVNLCTQLIRALEPRVPNVKMLVSTTTSTGMGELKKRLPNHIEKLYYPIDRRPWVSKAFAILHPEAVILVEAEIWPNFLWKARDRRVPVFLVNARLSERSFRGYRSLKFLFEPLFASLAGVGAQNQVDAERLLELGCRPEAVEIVGSLKFDAAKVDERRLLDVPAMLKQLGVPEDAHLLVAGSTHAGEEALLADVYLRLKKRFPKLFLILVPRHFERGREVGRALEAKGVKFIYRSEVTATTSLQPGSIECLLVNSTGELKYFYEHARVIFVGKSLCGQGGQSPIEPGALGKAMVFGPNMHNFAEIARCFVEKKGAIQVKNPAELESALTQLLGSDALREETGRNALAVVKANLGAIDRTVEMIVKHLKEEDTYVAPRPQL